MDFGTYTSKSTQLTEAFYDLNAAARRMAIYFAIFEVEKAGVTEAAINNISSVITPAPIKEVIKTSHEFKNMFALDK